MAGLLCLGGKLPNAELAFYLTLDELRQVSFLDDFQRRDLPRLLSKARRRQARAPILDKIIFTEPTMRWQDVLKLIQSVTGDLNDELSNNNTNIKQFASNNNNIASIEIDGIDLNNVPHVIGMPSCSGLVKGTCVIIDNINEAGDLLDSNSILITYSIDISWTVYFPIIKGIVTEIGAVVSHGAVVAREYNLPTLCTAIGACSVFKTGQSLVLDATRGICYLDQQQLL